MIRKLTFCFKGIYNNSKENHMKISNEIINICPEIKKWRHELHAHPELG